MPVEGLKGKGLMCKGWGISLRIEIECKDTTILRSVVGLRGIACLFLSIKAITWDYFVRNKNTAHCAYKNKKKSRTILCFLPSRSASRSQRLSLATLGDFLFSRSLYSCRRSYVRHSLSNLHSGASSPPLSPRSHELRGGPFVISTLH